MVFDDLPEFLEDLLGIDPYSGVFFFFFPPPAKLQAENPQGAHHGSADLPVSSQPSSESPHGPDDFLIVPPQLLLPDRKNGLASVEALHHELDRLFPHLFQSHCFLLQGSIHW